MAQPAHRNTMSYGYKIKYNMNGLKAESKLSGFYTRNEAQFMLYTRLAELALEEYLIYVYSVTTHN